MPARLTAHFRQRPSKVLFLREGRDHLIGRDRDSDLLLDDDRVSRRHALLAGDESGWRITDLGSKNGTAVDGRPVTDPAPTGDRSWLSLGGLLVEFRRVGSEALERDREERLRRLTTSLAAGAELVPSLGLEPLLERLLTSALEICRAERGFVLLETGGGELEIAAAARIEGDDLRASEFSGSSTAIQEVLASGRSIASSDAWQEPQLAERPSVLAAGIRALVCLPLVAMERVIGALYVDSRSPSTVFDELDVELLEALASHAALAIAVDGIQSELRGLAGALPARTDLPPETAELLAREIGRALDRAGAAAGSSARSGAPSWSEIRELHASAPEVST